jgi:hypothetical protein
LHKTEAQAIRLNLNSAESVAQAYGEIMAAALNYRADATIEGVLVQEMVGQSHEMFVGMVRDPTFGAVMTFGLGGIYVEVLKDLVFRLAPLSRQDILEALNELHAMTLLQGVRGQAPADIDALVDCIERVSWLAADYSDKIAEIDINPLCVLTAGQGTNSINVDWSAANPGLIANAITVFATSADGCVSTPVVLDVFILNIVPTLTAIGPYCADEPCVALAATPLGGVWTGTGVTGNTFCATASGAGTFTLTYTVTQGGCTFTATTPVTVNPIPVLSPIQHN